MKHLDLFSGIGGFSLAAQMVGGIETAQFVEIDPYCQKVLAKNFPGIPIHGDITTFTTTAGEYDLITGGFPCQDISCANPNGRGLEGERSGLFFELMRIVRECRPSYVVLENVAEMLRKNNGRIMGTVLWELSQSGYDAEWQVISAASVGAEHLRERIFIVSYSQRFGRRGRREFEKFSRQDSTVRTQSAVQLPGLVRSEFWQMPPSTSRTSNGVSRRVDRIKGLGNAVVPQVAAIALQRVLNLHKLDEIPA